MIVLQNGPWGQKPQNNDNDTDDFSDIDQLLKKTQKKFGGFGGRGGGFDFESRGIVFGIIIATLALWMATGLYRVEPEENAVIMTFGKWTDTRAEAGLGYHLPVPIQNVIKVNVGFDRRIEVGYRENSGNATVSAESMMLTGDENIIDINFVVLWRISDAGKYLFRIRDPEATIKKVAESAMRETIGQTEIQKAMTGARGDIENKTKILMQKILDDYESGVVINSVQLLRVDPPAPVVDAFDDVQRARTDLERLKNEAETYRNDIVPKARGEAQKMLQDAEAYKSAVIAKANGEAARFLSVYQAYAQAKDVTQTRLYIETMQDIMKKSRKFIVGDKNDQPVLPYMNIEKKAE